MKRNSASIGENRIEECKVIFSIFEFFFCKKNTS